MAFKDAEETPFEDYWIERDGTVWSTKRLRPKVLAIQTTPHGHKRVGMMIGGRNLPQLVHRLLAFAFIGPPPFEGAYVRHLNDVPDDNRIENLAWGTAQDNADDSKRNGSRLIGSRATRAKLTESDVVALREAVRGGASPKDAVEALQLQIDSGTASRAIRGENWAHVPGALPRLSRAGEKSPQAKLTEDDVRAIRASGETRHQLAARFGVTRATIGMVLRRDTWKHL